MEMTAISLEEMIGKRTAEQTLWQKVKSYVAGLFKKKNFLRVK